MGSLEINMILNKYSYHNLRVTKRSCNFGLPTISKVSSLQLALQQPYFTIDKMEDVFRSDHHWGNAKIFLIKLVKNLIKEMLIWYN